MKNLSLNDYNKIVNEVISNNIHYLFDVTIEEYKQNNYEIDLKTEISRYKEDIAKFLYDYQEDCSDILFVEDLCGVLIYRWYLTFGLVRVCSADYKDIAEEIFSKIE